MEVIKEVEVYYGSKEFSHFREKMEYINRLRRREMWGGSGESRADPRYHVRSGLEKNNMEVYLVESRGDGHIFFYMILVVDGGKFGICGKNEWDFPFCMDRKVQIVDIINENRVLMEGTLFRALKNC